jgi:hypothetical protein
MGDREQRACGAQFPEAAEGTAVKLKAGRAAAAHDFDAADKPVAVSGEGLLDTRNVCGVDPDANDMHNSSMPEPVLPATFAWVRDPGGRVLCCLPLGEVAHHAFTTRELELSAGGPAASGGWATLAAVVGVEVAHLATLTQVHGAHVVRVPEETNGPTAAGTWAEGDGLVTDRPNLALAVKVADCVPILLADRRTGAVAAVHAGWRGTAASIASAAVRELIRVYGVRPSGLVAAIGPSIGPCCCEVGTDVCDRFLEAGARPDELAEWFTVVPKAAQVEGLGLGQAARSEGRAGKPGKLWLDTWLANADQLVSAGVARERVYISGLCTACFPGLLHSYRVDGPRAGRMAGVIRRL